MGNERDEIRAEVFVADALGMEPPIMAAQICRLESGLPWLLLSAASRSEAEDSTQYESRKSCGPVEVWTSCVWMLRSFVPTSWRREPVRHGGSSGVEIGDDAGGELAEPAERGIRVAGHLAQVIELSD